MKHLADCEIPDTQGIDHDVFNFVDDSNSALSFNNIEQLNKYITAYMSLMIGYYLINKLKINESKTNLLLVEKQKSRKTKNKVAIKLQETEIKPKNQVKILGFKTTENLSMSQQANSLLMQVNHKLVAVKNIEKYMDFQTR